MINSLNLLRPRQASDAGDRIGVDSADIFYLLPTKLFRPPVTEDYVPRQHLLKQLDSARLKPLTLISAPAGYGKTTFMSAWLETCEIPSVWLSVDEDDNQLSVFLAYLLAAIQYHFPNACQATARLLDAVVLPPLPVIAGHLINDIDQIHRDFILVLDDYHLITAPAIHELLALLLHHPHRAMHLVIATRHDPPLPVIAMRARNQLAEIRIGDLRFSIEEIAKFMEKAVGVSLDDRIIAILDEQTEGWPAGMRFVSLSMLHGQDAEESIAGLQGSNRYISEYLMSEVFARLSPQLQDFLIKTSLVDRLCAPLCEAITGQEDPRHDGQPFLEWFEATNLFTIPLDDRRQWYRYHHLFRDILRRRLQKHYSPEQIAAFHRSASAWLAEHGQIDEAIDHALAGGDVQGAVQIVAAQRNALMNREEWVRLERLLKKFPQGAVDDNPELIVLSAWIYLVQGQFGKVWDAAERLRVFLAQTSLETKAERSVQGTLDVFLSIKNNWAGDFGGAIELARRGLENISRERYIARSYAWLHLASATLFTEGMKPALRILSEAQLEDLTDANPPRIQMTTSKLFIYWMAGDLTQLMDTANYVLKVVDAHHLPQTISWARLFAGCGYYHQNWLDAAEEHFGSLVNKRYLIDSRSFVQGAFGLASTFQAQGAEVEASRVVELALQYSQEMCHPDLQNLVKSFQVELALRQGNVMQATYLASQLDFTIQSTPMPYFYQPELTLPKLLIAQNTPSSLQEAGEVLSRLYELTESMHITRYLIETLALQSLLFDAQGDEQAAFKALTHSVVLAQPSSYIRVFVDLGPRMADLLSRLRKEGILPEYLQEILLAFPTTARDSMPSQPQKLVEPLTTRELQVLALLTRRYSNKEIADSLVISPVTVKRHTINIYQKLSVKNRREAVTSAIHLGLVPPDR